jgi:signal transduction histidine kinase/ActR/RegA family two-component response regulator
MLNRQEALITGMNRIFLEALTSETEAQLGSICLAVAGQVTNSRFGLLCKINAAGGFENLAVSIPDQTGWITDVQKQGPPAGRPSDLCRRMPEEAFFTNDPDSHPAVAGLPKEYPELHSFMSVPLISTGKIIGMLAVGNRDGGYRPEDLTVLKGLAGAVMQVLIHKRTEQALAAELAKNKRLQEISARLIPEGDVDALLADILKAAIDFMEADMGNIQLCDTVRNELRIIAHEGFTPSYLKFFECVKAGGHCASSVAMEKNRRIVVPDVETSELFDGKPSRSVQLEAGVRALQATPLVSRSGRILGMISTHWRRPHDPGLRELRLLDMLARQAADAIERQQTQIALLKSHDRLEARVVERTVELEIRARQLQWLALELSRAEEKEHERIAEILHEDLQQNLSALKFRLWNLFPEDRMDPELKQKISDLENLIYESIQKTRQLSHELSPPVLKQNGLMAALKWLGEEMLSRHGLKVTLTTRGEVNPKSTAVASLLYRAVRELLFNTVRHASTDTAAVEAVRDGRTIWISVMDTGKGFDPENCVIAKSEAGFGLFSLRERISYLGGRVDIRSAPGMGCCVTLSLDASEPMKLPALVNTQLPEMAVTAASLPETAAAGGKIRILLADDHTIMREGLANLFKGKEDFEVVAQAANGREAVRYAAEANPDVILMDVSMPEMDGIKATALISTSQPGIRIVGLSMHDDDETRKRMLAAGAAGYIYKDAPANQLIETIRNIYKHGGLRDF